MNNEIEAMDNEWMDPEEMEIMDKTMVEETVLTENDADRLIRIYKGIKADLQRFRSIADGHIKEIEREYELKEKKANANMENILLQLKKFAESKPMKESKTQKKYQLLSGDIIIKNPVKQLKADNDVVLAAINGTEYNNYVRSKTVLAWDLLKKRLAFTNDGLIIDNETGELVDLDGLTVEEKPGSIEIK